MSQIRVVEDISHSDSPSPDFSTYNCRWTEAETVALLAAYEGYLSNVSGSVNVRDHSMYQRLTERLRGRGFVRSSRQVRARINNLKKDYRQIIREHITCGRKLNDREAWLIKAMKKIMTRYDGPVPETVEGAIHGDGPQNGFTGALSRSPTPDQGAIRISHDISDGEFDDYDASQDESGLISGVKQEPADVYALNQESSIQPPPPLHHRPDLLPPNGQSLQDPILAAIQQFSGIFRDIEMARMRHDEALENRRMEYQARLMEFMEERRLQSQREIMTIIGQLSAQNKCQNCGQGFNTATSKP